MAAKPAKKKIIRHTKDGIGYVNVVGADDELKLAVSQTLSRHIGHYQVAEMEYDYALSSLVLHDNAILEALESHGYDVDKGVGANFFKLIEEYKEEMEAMLGEKLKRGEIEFPDIPFLLKQGSDAIAAMDGHAVAGHVESVELKYSFMAGPFYQIKIKVIANLDGAIGNELYSANIFSWTGFMPVAQIGVRRATAEDKARLTERGRRFIKYATGIQYCRYIGQIKRHSWYGVKSYRADGRVMVDLASFREIEDDQYRSEQRASGIEGRDHYDDNASTQKQDMKVTEQDLWRCFPFLYGFSFKAKQWGRLDVESITDIQFRDDSWDKLVLQEDKKALIRAIVEHQQGTFTDIVEDKGGGSIFLLHGPPGQGKTLTAETIAEILHRPLYAISVGELGVSPDELEERLRTILDLATVWNAVLLLDEADIFLEARDERDIVRNAMVGVFLRLLEYHQGVLFLTTNRVKNIDQAFYSRISIGLEFPAAEDEKRAKIWMNLLDAAELLDNPIAKDDIDVLARHDLNGRQIKNVIRLAQTVAKSQNAEVSMAHLDEVIALTGQFKKA